MRRPSKRKIEPHFLKRAPRYNINTKIKISAQLIGSRQRHDFITENISESGLLIRSQGSKLTFNQQSIIEAWVYPEGAEDDPIFFICKFARKNDDLSIGIRITSIDEHNTERYFELINMLAEKENELAKKDDESQP